MLVLSSENPRQEAGVTLGLTALFAFTQGVIDLNYLFFQFLDKGFSPHYILFSFLVVYNGRVSHSSYLVLIGSECLSQLSFH